MFNVRRAGTKLVLELCLSGSHSDTLDGQNRFFYRLVNRSRFIKQHKCDSLRTHMNFYNAEERKQLCCSYASGRFKNQRKPVRATNSPGNPFMILLCILRTLDVSGLCLRSAPVDAPYRETMIYRARVYSRTCKQHVLMRRKHHNILINCCLKAVWVFIAYYKNRPFFFFQRSTSLITALKCFAQQFSVNGAVRLSPL